MSRTPAKQKSIAIIGTGAVGTALAVLLQNAGYSISALAGHNQERTDALRKRLNIPNEHSNNDAAIEKSEVIFFCLPDDALKAEIERSANVLPSFKGKIFFHTSGALTSSLFEPMRNKEASGASFHPLQTIPKDVTEISLQDFAVALEGDREAVDFGVAIVNAIGAKPMLLQADQKTMYHVTATLASNGLVGLSGVVEEMINTVGLGEEGREHFYKLMGQSLENSRSMTAPEAITGPASRGDIATLKQHVSSLRQYSPHMLPVYVVIGSHCVSLAIQSGKLSQEQGEEILDVFSNELQGLTM